MDAPFFYLTVSRKAARIKQLATSLVDQLPPLPRSAAPQRSCRADTGWPHYNVCSSTTNSHSRFLDQGGRSLACGLCHVERNST